MKEKVTKRYKNPSQRVNRHAYLFIAPFVIGFLVFSLYPILRSVGLSFVNDNFKNKFGQGELETFNLWSNYRFVIEDKQYWHCYFNTIVIFVMNFIPQIVSALFFAAIFTSRRIKMKGKRVFQFIYFLPNILTATTVAAIFMILWSRDTGSGGTFHGGPLYELFVSLGMDPTFQPLRDPWTVRLIVAFIQFWMWFGNSMIVYISGIRAIDNEIFEAAELDGASNSRVFFSITLPILKPIMLYSLITSIIGGLQMFDIPYMIYGEDFTAPLFGLSNPLKTVTIYIYEHMKEMHDYSIASAASVILFFFSLGISILMYFTVFKEKNISKKTWRKINALKRV